MVSLGGVGVLVPCGVWTLWSHLPGLNFFLSFFPLKLVHCFSQRSYLIDYFWVFDWYFFRLVLVGIYSLILSALFARLYSVVM